MNIQNTTNMFMEQASYVGDVLSFYLDNQFQETFTQYAQQTNNVFELAYMFGYKPKTTGVAQTTIDFYQQLPSIDDGTGNYVPDRKGGLLPYSLFNLSRVAKQILADANLPSDLVLQDLRRTAITEMIEVGVPITNIMSVSGHATPQSLTPYIKNTLRSATVTQEMRGLV